MFSKIISLRSHGLNLTGATRFLLVALLCLVAGALAPRAFGQQPTRELGVSITRVDDGEALTPRALGQQPVQVTVDAMFGEGVHNHIRTAEHQDMDATMPPFNGDLVSGVVPVYEQDKIGGARIGTLYYFGVGTARPEDLETAGIHFYPIGRIELVGRGSIDIVGTNKFGGPSYFSVIGGTGNYVGASGQCVLEDHASGASRFSCSLR